MKVNLNSIKIINSKGFENFPARFIQHRKKQDISS